MLEFIRTCLKCLKLQLECRNATWRTGKERKEREMTTYTWISPTIAAKFVLFVPTALRFLALLLHRRKGQHGHRRQDGRHRPRQERRRRRRPS